MKPLKTKLQKTGYVLGIALFAFVLGTLLQFAKAWTEPPVAPPTATIGAPVNTGATYQYKSGSLGVGGNFFAAGAVYSTDSPTYGQTLLNTWGLSSGGDIYLEPAAGNHLYLTDSWSRTGTLSMQFGRTEITNGGAYGQGGLVIGNQSLNSNGNGWLYLGDSNNNVYGGQGIAAQNLYASGEICIAGDCRTAWPASAGGDNMGNESATTDMYMNGNNIYGVNYFQTNTITTTMMYSSGASYASAYYDNTDRSYYMQPGGTSRMNWVNVNDLGFPDGTFEVSAGTPGNCPCVKQGSAPGGKCWVTNGITNNMQMCTPGGWVTTGKY